MNRLRVFVIYSVMVLTVIHNGLPLDVQRAKRTFLKDSLELDKLQRAVEISPFKIWLFKETFKSMQDILLTSELLDEEIVERKGTIDRLQDAMKRALLGQDTGVVVMGGSISAGGGLINDNPDVRGTYYRVFIDWWEKTVEPFTDSKIRLRNLAIGGTCSDFYFYCFNTFLQPQETMDIVFLEFSVNDYLIFRASQFPKVLSLEKLTRKVLREQNLPAIIYVNFIKGVQSTAQCDNLENSGQTMLAWHYGITSVSSRNALCPNAEKRKNPLMYSSDGNHPSLIAHAQMALMIINSVRSALLRAIRNAKQNILENHSSEELPRHVFYSMEPYIPPLCYTLITPDRFHKVVNPSLLIQVTENKGFKQFEIKGIGFFKTPQVKNTQEPQRTDGFGGWQAENENSTLKIRLILPCDVGNSNCTKSVVIAFRTHGFGGKAEVWLDDNRPGTVIDTMSGYGHTLLATIAEHVTSGIHTLHLRTMNAGKFMLCGVMAGESSVPTDK